MLQDLGNSIPGIPGIPGIPNICKVGPIFAVRVEWRRSLWCTAIVVHITHFHLAGKLRSGACLGAEGQGSVHAFVIIRPFVLQLCSLQSYSCSCGCVWGLHTLVSTLGHSASGTS